MDKFLDFLKLHGVFIAYFRNCKLQRGRSPKEQIEYLKRNTIQDYINVSFAWHDASEGRNFWEGIHTDWYKFCQNRNIKVVEDLEYSEEN